MPYLYCCTCDVSPDARLLYRLAPHLNSWASDELTAAAAAAVRDEPVDTARFYMCAVCAGSHALALPADSTRWHDADELVTAADTGEMFASTSGLYFDDASGDWYVSPPEDDDGDSSDYLRSYGTDILDVLGWPSETPRDALCFGVELECEPKSGYGQRDLVDALSGIPGTIMKEDGSLSRGVELVTLPYTLEHHQQMFGWERHLSGDVHHIGKSGAGTTACGIHVHVNRDALSPLTIGKMLVFLNSIANSGFVSYVAQRTSNGYAQRDARKKLTDIRGGSRYDLLNVSGSATVEFRLFRGNLRPERVLKNLEFCHALVRFCESTGIKRSASKDAFLEFVATRSATYPHLATFLAAGPYVAGPIPAERLAALSDV